MQQFPGFIVIVDISGYTGFVKMHRTSMVHAEQVITDLMESVLAAQNPPLVLDKLQGDAAIFYAKDTGDGAAPEIAAQVTRFFEAFDERERVLVSCNLCICDACQEIGGLQLKAILHHGDLIVKEMGGSTELGGTDIILAHRMLKNHVQADEYILMTSAFHELAGHMDGLEPNRGSEETDLGKVDYVVFYPDPNTDPMPNATWMARAKQLARIELLGARRMLKRGRDRTFSNLPGR